MGSHNARNTNVMGSRLFFEHSITFCWVHFAGKMPASNILYNLLWFKRMKEEQGL